MSPDAGLAASSTLFNQTRIEWIKYWSKPVARFVLGLMFITPVAGEALLARMSIRDATFPRVSHFIFSPDLMMFLGMIMVVIAVLGLGSDFDVGTVRMILSRGVRRAEFIAAKLFTAFGAALIGGAIYTGAGFAAIAVVHKSSGSPPILVAGGEDILWRGLAAVGMVSVVTFVLSGIVMLAVVLGRSSWAGLLAGLGYFFADFLVGVFGLGNSLGVADSYRYTMTYHVLSVFERLFPLDPSLSLPRAWAGKALVDPRQALLLLFLYGVGTSAAAMVVFNRQDLHTG